MTRMTKIQQMEELLVTIEGLSQALCMLDTFPGPTRQMMQATHAIHAVLHDKASTASQIIQTLS